MIYCVATRTAYITRGAQGRLAWTRNKREAMNRARALGGAVFDAQAFAANPDPEAHRPIFASKPYSAEAALRGAEGKE